MEKEYIGIDYSLGKANYNLETGIHYGIISQNEVLQAWADSSEPYYGNINYCSACGGENDIENEFCEVCGSEMEIDFLEPISFYVDDKEYQAESDDYGDIFITKSPFYTTCQYCFPCAPGAGYIMNTVEDGVKTYCFGHDWFEDKKAPYPVYNIKTGKLIEP